MSMPLVLSVQSHVAYGHAGNAAAIFPLQRLGVEVVAVHTVQFSNHTGYGSFSGQVFGAEHVRDVLHGLGERGVPERCSAVLSGYLGDAQTGAVILEAVEHVRTANPNAIYLCDPVMGDVGRGLFVRPGIPAFLRDRALAAADLITPNQFEFEWLTGVQLRSTAAAVAAARGLLTGRRLRAVVITSLRTADVPATELHTLGVTADGAWRVSTPLITSAPLPNGMGDVFSAVLLAKLLHGEALERALSHAVSTLYALVCATVPGQRDLPLIAEQKQIEHPSRRFRAERLG